MKISKRYPIDPATNDIDRAWLVDQLPRAKRPNALLEVALQPLPIYRIALQTWVTVDTLIDFLLGDDDLTPFELQSLNSVLDIYGDGGSTEFLTDEVLSVYTKEEDTEIHEDYKAWPVIGDLIDRLLDADEVPSCAVFAAAKAYDLAGYHPIHLGPCDKPRSKRITRRRRKAA